MKSPSLNDETRALLAHHPFLLTAPPHQNSIDEFDATSPAAVAELATGKAYVHSAPDRFGRPVVVIRVRKHVVNEFPLADSKRLCGHVLDQAVAALPPGGEQIAGVFDLRGFGLQNADLAFAAFLVEAFFEYYPRRCAARASFGNPGMLDICIWVVWTSTAAAVA